MVRGRYIVALKKSISYIELNKTKSKKKEPKRINFRVKKKKKFLGILMCEFFKKEKDLIGKIIEKQKNLNVSRDNLKNMHKLVSKSL